MREVWRKPVPVALGPSLLEGLWVSVRTDAKKEIGMS